MNQLENDIIEMAMYKIACYDEGMEKTAIKTETYLKALSNKLQRLNAFDKGLSDAASRSVKNDHALGGLLANLGGKRLNANNLPYVRNFNSYSNIGNIMEEVGQKNKILDMAKDRIKELTSKLENATNIFKQEYPGLAGGYGTPLININQGGEGFFPPRNVFTDIESLPGKFLRSKANRLRIS